MVIDKDNILNIKASLEKAIKDTLNHYDINVHIHTIQYDKSALNIQCNYVDMLNKDEVEKKQRNDFNIYAHFYGFERNDYKRTFQLNGETYQLVGFDVNARKYKAKIKRILDGQDLHTTTTNVKVALKRTLNI